MSRASYAQVVLVCAAACLFGPPVLAQTAGTLRGVVLDDQGHPLAGVALVVASSSRSVSGRGAVTDAAGVFQVPALPASGDYFVRASFPGFASVDLTGVEVRGGATTSVRITLATETAFRERVEVRARPQVVDLESTTTETRLTSEFIENLPILGRNYQDILALAPGVSDVDGDGNPNIHGARDTDVVTLVDGVSTTDPLTGKIGAQLNIESIQEIEIKTSGATAEYSRAQGGFANIITKSGGNEFKATLKIFWRGSALDGDGAGIDDPRLHGGVGENGLRDLTFNDYLPFLSVEGPIVRDRAWFFAASELVHEETPVNTVNNAFVTETREFRQFVKLTWQPGANHRLALSLNYDPQEYLNQGVNGLTRVESGFTTSMGGPILTLKGTSMLSPNVSLESSLSHFDEGPSRTPTTDPDTNGDGFLRFDRNGNGFYEASERDPGEDYDQDGVFDVFEDFNHDGDLEPDEDRDDDGMLTRSGRAGLPGGCEGAGREDIDCDGRLDTLDEDLNHNDLLDPFEDVDGDGHLDRGIEDRNHNGLLDDSPVPETLYPYGSLAPRPPDRDYTIDQRLGITSGPYYQTFSDSRRRLTLREDLSVYVPDYWGSHDLKFGLVGEKEDFERTTDGRPVVAPLLRNKHQGLSTVRALLPAEATISNDGHALTIGVYAQETYKPFPNVSVGVGLRLDRETNDSYGYTPFEPARERALYDRLVALTGLERGRDDFLQGNNDGVISNGYCSDPIFYTPGLGNPCNNPLMPDGSDPNRDAVAVVEQSLAMIKSLAPSRLTRHHVESRFSSAQLTAIFPDILVDGEVDPTALAAHGVQAQAREPFRLTNNNLAPRLSVSWDPFSNGRTKVFATWGRYYDKLFLSTIVGEEGPDTLNRYYLLDENGSTGNGTPDHGIGRVLSKAPPSATQIDRGMQTPFADELTLGFERELAPELALSVTWIARHYRQQLQDIDVNHTLRLDPLSGRPRDDIGALRAAADPGDNALGVRTTRLPDGRPDLYIENYFFNQVLRVGNSNEARYTGFEVTLLKRLSRRWEMQGSYTYSRAMGNAEDFDSRLGNDPSTLENEFGYLEYDQRHVVKLNAAAYLPHDWQLGAALSWASGLPYSVISRFFALDNVDYQQFRTRYGSTGSDATTGRPVFVDERRNAHRNDAVLDLNLRARKSLVIGRHVSALFLEVFNVLNSDDLRVFTFEPDRADPVSGEDLQRVQALQVDATRRFGRRFQVGFQIEF